MSLAEKPSENYLLRSPVPSSIYPFITSPEKTLSLLHEINASQPPSIRLPEEILLQVNDELHRPNPLREYIRANWMPFEDGESFDFHYDTKFRANLDMNEMKYLVALPVDQFNSVGNLWRHVSSADVLYRLLCYFPDMPGPPLDEYNCVWGVDIRHQPTGRILQFYEDKGAVKVNAFHIKGNGDLSNDEPKASKKFFHEESVKLLNALFGRKKGTRRFSCYHPAADADHPTSTEGYTAVPIEVHRSRVGIYAGDDDDDGDEYGNIFRINWRLSTTFKQDFSSFHSILRDLKYNVQTRKIVRDRSSDTANLTTVISSALLLYRLVCRYLPSYYRFIDQSQSLGTTSIWQIQITHTSGESLIFMDDHGLFDIRASAGIDKVEDDVDALVEALCSDSFCHPYDGLVAGCVA